MQAAQRSVPCSARCIWATPAPQVLIIACAVWQRNVQVAALLARWKIALAVHGQGVHFRAAPEDEGRAVALQTQKYTQHVHLASRHIPMQEAAEPRKPIVSGCRSSPDTAFFPDGSIWGWCIKTGSCSMMQTYQRCHPTWCTSRSRMSTRRTAPSASSTSALTARSLRMQKPEPESGNAWWVPPAVLHARPCASASRAVSSVPARQAAHPLRSVLSVKHTCSRPGHPHARGIAIYEGCSY